MATLSAKDLQEHIEVLTGFQRDYRDYVEALEHQLTTDQPRNPPEAMHEAARRAAGQRLREKRAALVRAAPRAARAIQASGLKLEVTPPPMFEGRPPVTEFVSQLFAHETQTYGSGPDPLLIPRMLLDGMQTALGYLDLAPSRRHAQDSAKTGPPDGFAGARDAPR